MPLSSAEKMRNMRERRCQQREKLVSVLADLNCKILDIRFAALRNDVECIDDTLFECDELLGEANKLLRSLNV